MKSAITISLVPEARGGPFVYWDGLERGAESAKQHGFDAIEVFPRSPEEINGDQLAEVLARTGLKLAAMGTGAGWVVHKLRLTDADPAIRAKAVQFAGGVVDLAGRFGAPAILGSMQGRVEPGQSREQALGWLAEGVEALAARAAQKGAQLFLEPLNRYETNVLVSVADSAAFVRSLKATNVKLLCDLFHLNIEEASIPDALKCCGDLLGHVHFADSNRRAVGFGHTEYKSIIRTLREMGYQGYLSAEIFPLPDAETAAAQTMKAFRELTAA